jgi:hypothetical protein
MILLVDLLSSIAGGNLLSAKQQLRQTIASPPVGIHEWRVRAVGPAPPRDPPRNLLLATAAQLNLLLDESKAALKYAARGRKV